MTVLVCVLTEATVLASQLGPEVMFNLMQGLFALAQSEVQRYEGTISQYRGGGFMALFGAPLAHEDHALRAVLAALALQRRFREEAMTLGLPPGEGLGLRVGLHTGPVVVGSLGDDAQMTYTAVGDTTQLADRLLQRAEPGTILASHATAQLVRGDVRLEDRGFVDSPGKTDMVLAYRIVSHQPRRSSWPGRRERPLSRFVGRTRELAFLHERLTQTKNGQGQVVGVVGEPGLGKSRLLYEFHQGLQEQRATYLEGRCLSYGRTVPYLPLLDLLRQNCRITDADRTEAVADKVRQSLQEVEIEPDTWAPYLLHLLGIPAGTERLAGLSPEAIKTRTLELLWQMSLTGSRRRPLIFAVEDLHWIDATSEECFTALIERMAGAPILYLLTYRPGYRPPWIEKSYATQVSLTPLMPDESRRVVQEVLRTTPSPGPVIQEILAKAQGNPFFLEELCRHVVEHGDLLPSVGVPDTIQTVLAARIDRLPPAEKRLLQAAAVIGKEVPFALLQAITAQAEEEVHRSLRHLQAAEFLYELHLFPSRVYTFKHALTQEVAYQSLLQRTRQQYHRQIAQVLVEQFPDTAATQPELLAHHYTEAGLGERAIPYWQQAGQRAVERSANVEAIGHFTKGLEILKTFPETLKRIHQALQLQLALGVPLLMSRGHTAPEVEHAYGRALELCQQIGDSPQRFSALVGLWRFYLSRAQLQTAHALGEQCFTFAQRVQDPALLLEAHLMLGSTLLFLGDLVAAHTHLEHGVHLSTAQQSGALAFSRGTEPRVVCLCRSAWTLWWLGYPDRALHRSQEALHLALQLSHPYSLGFALQYSSVLHQWRREISLVKERSEAVLALMKEHGFVQWLGRGMCGLGWVLAAQGLAEDGIAHIRRGLAVSGAAGLELGQQDSLMMLAEAYGKAGRAADGLSVLTEVLAAAYKSGELYWEAELYRLKGELLLQRDASSFQAEAEACFRQAINIARNREAKGCGPFKTTRPSHLISRRWAPLF